MNYDDHKLATPPYLEPSSDARMDAYRRMQASLPEIRALVGYGFHEATGYLQPLDAQDETFVLTVNLEAHCNGDSLQEMAGDLADRLEELARQIRLRRSRW